MLTKRIVPCLDVNMGKVVKGINFVDLQDVGDPVEIAEHYNRQGADEIVFLDITATHEKRKTIINLVERTAEKVFIPLTVGGGISQIDDFKNILRAGADKISINSSAIRNPNLIYEAADKFGSQCVVVAVDAKKRDSGDGWDVFVEGGRKNTGIDALKWIKKAESLGAGEILLTSMDADGTKNGYDIELTRTVTNLVNIPVIASGGCGSLNDFYDVFNDAGADAALAASLFHYGELTVGEVKQYLKTKDIPVRV
ncbi:MULTISPECIES: imidazole glycerol phosphate synthase subunit HisF [Clostridium]|uniref:Imidazole glycerol phosphate synthase subunit HisF n=2 Tax=Clostridium TaxID=1485 RepID=D8GRA3_CLOLD|nr:MULTISPECIES: imidazole glycerol phosphate synthase subunit HisF [Clostridium]ADK14241.1 imidazole glycerol phosphate synthase subunit [Clostridium ljungdahlii DSM 13528]AGY77467.1 imidazole glycerol phosphate synthase subunit HisF [Clostridium autoethanogenum DSM 10061]ALU37608.1 Imidazole glycerol phosphate synthase subunit hisF [Clostridium autoethanogenum DSM 10061]OAA86082.1 Imidazole glycerol phosphate synthase subunit HisF [Clostridium ljungdahlii DSM 13528]OVY49255.1 Imidazole glyce